MKRNYIQPKSEFVEFGTNNNIMTGIEVGSAGKGSVTGPTMGTNEADFDDDIDWDEEE